MMVHNFFVTKITKMIQTDLYYNKKALLNISFRSPDLIALLWCYGFVKSAQLSQQCFVFHIFTGNFLSYGSVMVLSL